MGTVAWSRAPGLRLTMSQRALDEMSLFDPREDSSTIWEHWEKNKDPNTNTVLDDLNLEGRLNYFNSTNAATWVTIGAVGILIVAVMLYLYDFYATTARSMMCLSTAPMEKRQAMALIITTRGLLQRA